jgi:PhnB protein
MSSRLNPYLGFRDNARQAMEFYHSVFGGELALSTFGEMHASEDPAEAEKIMHGILETPQGYTIMASDTPDVMDYVPSTNQHSVSISGDGEDADALRGFFDKLAASGQVSVPLETAPWGDVFGMCVDGYGVNWLVNIAGAPQG